MIARPGKQNVALEPFIEKGIFPVCNLRLRVAFRVAHKQQIVVWVRQIDDRKAQLAEHWAMVQKAIATERVDEAIPILKAYFRLKTKLTSVEASLNGTIPSGVPKNPLRRTAKPQVSQGAPREIALGRNHILSVHPARSSKIKLLRAILRLKTNHSYVNTRRGFTANSRYSRFMSSCNRFRSAA